MTVTFDEYFEEKQAFAQKHNKKAECKVYTSPMVNNVYHKEYCWSDGAMFCERTELVKELVEAEAHGIKLMFEAEFYKTEFWSSEQPSKYYYEKA